LGDAFIKVAGIGLNFVTDIVGVAASCSVSLTLFHHELIEIGGWSCVRELVLAAMQ